MTLVSPSEIREVQGITAEQQALIMAFLQGAVYSWVKNRSGESFTARDLVGVCRQNLLDTFTKLLRTVLHRY